MKLFRANFDKNVGTPEEPDYTAYVLAADLTEALAKASVVGPVNGLSEEARIVIL